MTILDDIRRDRDAGTPGPWRFVEVDDYGVSFEVRGADESVVCCDTRYYPTAVDQDDARRIARVPQMEAALLAAEELAKAVEAMRAQGVSVDAYKKLVNFRAAMEEAQ